CYIIYKVIKMDNISTKKNIGYRLATLFNKTNKKQKELAEYLEVKPNVVSYFVNGERVPNTEQVIKIATFFNVSTDYLLGLTDITTTDKDLKFICDYTGLSEEAIASLVNLIKSEPEEHKLKLKKVELSNSEIVNNFISGGYLGFLSHYTLSYSVYKGLEDLFEIRTKVNEEAKKRGIDIKINMGIDKIREVVPDLFTCEHLAKGMLTTIEETVSDFAKDIYAVYICGVPKEGEE
ncbi:MAG: helix-turn-helix transcriptional regulator, partial [Acutalibacteraceae bacterium]|nr:helix-turn-helix transcriptional regulator [Acutalibacteraceae bacterium]